MYGTFLLTVPNKTQIIDDTRIVNSSIIICYNDPVTNKLTTVDNSSVPKIDSVPFTLNNIFETKNAPQDYVNYYLDTEIPEIHLYLCPEDLNTTTVFTEVENNNMILEGKVTQTLITSKFEIPPQFKTLPLRVEIIVTNDEGDEENVFLANYIPFRNVKTLYFTNLHRPYSIIKHGMPVSFYNGHVPNDVKLIIYDDMKVRQYIGHTIRISPL